MKTLFAAQISSKNLGIVEFLLTINFMIMGIGFISDRFRILYGGLITENHLISDLNMYETADGLLYK